MGGETGVDKCFEGCADKVVQRPCMERHGVGRDSYRAGEVSKNSIEYTTQRSDLETSGFGRGSYRKSKKGWG